MAIRQTRIISWIKAARKDFDAFPRPAQDDVLSALTMAADGGFPTTAKPMNGLGAGVYEIALRHRTDAYRAVYTLQFKDTLWVVHAFQKKSKTGIKTPSAEIDLVAQRLRRLKEMLK
ncbi:MAG: type II toxin-antitoxin system RelE/ParE family toxin [Devosia sp.]|nr:type II toxin-antitoxin system RelE/ParE family toxin [Devosia sp.]